MTDVFESLEATFMNRNTNEKQYLYTYLKQLYKMANDTYYSNFIISVVKRHKCPQFKVTRLYIHDNLYINIDTDT